MQEAKKHQQEVSRRQREEARRQLLMLLPEVDIMTKHDMTSRRRHLGTATWIFDDPAFKRFDDSPASACLCCYGILGSGKTYLASSLIDHALLEGTEQDELVLYHYFDYMDKRSLSVSALLSAFLRQFIKRRGWRSEIEESLQGIVTAGYTTAHEDFLIDLFIGTCTKHLKQLLVVLDGIDELTKEEQQKLIMFTEKMLTTQNLVIKVVATCRTGEKGLQDGLSDIRAGEIFIEAGTVAKDIGKIVRTAIKRWTPKFRTFDSHVSNSIIKALEPQADGMYVAPPQNLGLADQHLRFLLVQCQLDELDTAPSIEIIMNVLGDLPKDVITAYDRAMERRLEGKNDRNKLDLATRAFKWLVCAQRHLRLQEVMEAVVLNPDDKTFPRHRVHHDEGQYLLDACGNLVIYDTESDVLTFAHSTVSRYLLGQWADDVKLNAHFSLEEADRYVCELCFTYLSLKDFEARMVKSRVALDLDSQAIRHAITTPNGQGRVLYRAATFIKRPSEGSSAQSKQIDLNRLLRNQLERGGSEGDRAYMLLDYVKQYWLFHAAELQPEHHSDSCDVKLWLLFKYLVYERRTTFTFLPWKEETFRTSFPVGVRGSASIQWAAYHENLSLLCLLLGSGETLCVYPKDKPQPILLAWQYNRRILMLHFINSGYFRPAEAWTRTKYASTLSSFVKSILFEEAAQLSPGALPILTDRFKSSEDMSSYLDAFAYCATGDQQDTALNLLKHMKGSFFNSVKYDTKWYDILALAIQVNRNNLFPVALKGFFRERGMTESELDAALEYALKACIHASGDAVQSQLSKYRGFVSVLRACPGSYGAMARSIAKNRDNYPELVTGLFIRSTRSRSQAHDLDLSLRELVGLNTLRDYERGSLASLAAIGPLLLDGVLRVVKELHGKELRLSPYAIDVIGTATCYMPLLAHLVKSAHQGMQHFDMAEFYASHSAWRYYMLDLYHLELRTWPKIQEWDTSGKRTAGERLMDWIDLSDLLLTLRSLLQDSFMQTGILECRIWDLLDTAKSLAEQPLDLTALYIYPPGIALST